MYPRPVGSTLLAQTGGSKKVDAVCDALRSTMETLDQNKSVNLSLLTSVCLIYFGLILLLVK